MIKHPAKYNDKLLPIMAELLKDTTNIIDQFGGTGKIFELKNYGYSGSITCVEIEPEWAAYDERIITGNALDLPFYSNHFDGCCTSITYGNRMADSHIAKDNSKRITYTHSLGRKLHPNNSGQLQWGTQYKLFHLQAWVELIRVLKDGSIFILNCKNHIRNGQEQFVTEWHKKTLENMGFHCEKWHKIPCNGMGFGKNAKLRVEYENLLKFRLDK